MNSTGTWDLGRYLALSISSTMPGGEGNVTYPGGVEQRSHSPLALVGVSLDIQVGWIPPLREAAYETGFGLSKHFGIGFVRSQPTPSGTTEYGALALHLGIGVGSPIIFTIYDPVWQRVTLPSDLNPSWNQGVGR